MLYGESDPVFFGWYLFLWGIFTAYMFVATLKKNRALQTVFLTLTILFVLLAMGHWWDNSTIIKIAGYEGSLGGASNRCLAAIKVINETYERTVLPIG